MALTRPRYSQIYDTDYKQSVRVATTADVGNLLATGNMTNTVDGASLVLFDRILVKDQNDSKQNGIYRVLTVGTGSNGTWGRALDADANDKVTSGLTTTVAEGDTNLGKTFKLATPDPITIGVTGLTFLNPFTSAYAAAGGNTQVQFNDGGTIGATSNFIFNKANNSLTVTGNVNAGAVYTDNLFYANGAAFGSGSTDKLSSSASNVTVTANHVNVAINGSNVAAFSSNGLEILTTTQSTSTTTGALQVDGGAGITGNLQANAVYTNNLFYANGAVYSSGSVTTSETPPVSPTAGALWWDSYNGALKIYYTDGDSSQWVDASIATSSAGSASAVGSSSVGFEQNFLLMGA